MNHVKGVYSNRYRTVNLTNRHTVEIRIFRGTFKLNILFAMLQFANHLCDLAVYSSDTELESLTWHDFLNDIHGPEPI